MPKRVQMYRVTGSVMQSLVGLAGEAIINLTNQSIHVHDGVTPGGTELAKADLENVDAASATGAGKMSAAQAVALETATSDISALDARLTTAESDIDTAESDISTLQTQMATKMPQDSDAVEGNIGKFDSSGNIVDAGVAFNASVFAAGTRMLFQQAAAPTGWSIETGAAYSNAAMKIVTSGTPTTGGSDAFSTVFGAEKTTAGHALTIAEMPAHDHPLTNNTNVTRKTSGPIELYTGGAGTDGTTATLSVGNRGGNAAHAHDLTMNIKYAEFILCQKD